MRYQLLILAIFACSSTSLLSPSALAMYGLESDSPSSSSLADLILSSPKKPSPVELDTTEEAQDLAEELSTEKTVEVSESESAMPIVAEWEDPLKILCDGSLDKWKVKDSLLASELAYVFMDDGHMEAFKQVRRASLAAWTALKKTKGKEEVFTTLLLSAVQKALRDKKINKNPSESFARWVMQFDLSVARADFVKIMLKITDIKSPYGVLLLSVLGYRSFDELNARNVNGVDLSDINALHRFFAEMVIAYRNEYDIQYQVARELRIALYAREHTLTDAQLFELEKAEYLGMAIPTDKMTGSSFNENDWHQELVAARYKAHQLALEFVQKKLTKIGSALLLFHARLESVRVPDKVFEYPSGNQALSVWLYDSHVYSILVGIVYRLAERFFRGKAEILDLTDMQSIMSREYRGQMLCKHIPLGVPGGEFDAKGAMPSASSTLFERERRRSFEARLGILSGDIDFLDYASLAPNIQKAVSSFRVSDGIVLYKKIAGYCSYINGVAWGILPQRNKKAVVGALTKEIGVVRGYLGLLGIKSGTRSEVATSYKSIMDQIAAWTPHKAFAFNTSFSLVGGSRSATTKVICSEGVYQNLYKLLWLCIYCRLLAIEVNQRQEETVKKVQGATVVTEAVDLFDENGVLRAGIKATEMAAPKASTPLANVGEQLANFGKVFARHSQQITDKLTIKNDLDGAIDETINALGTTGDLTRQIQKSMLVAYQESDRSYGKLLLSFKALTVYTHWMTEYANSKISSMQKAIRTLFDKAWVKVLRAVAGSKIEKALRDLIVEVSEVDRQLLLKIKMAQKDLEDTLNGKITDPSKIILPEEDETYLLAIKAEQSLTREGRSKAMDIAYDLGVPTANTEASSKTIPTGLTTNSGAMVNS